MAGLDPATHHINQKLTIHSSADADVMDERPKAAHDDGLIERARSHPLYARSNVAMSSFFILNIA